LGDGHSPGRSPWTFPRTLPSPGHSPRFFCIPGHSPQVYSTSEDFSQNLWSPISPYLCKIDASHGHHWPPIWKFPRRVRWSRSDDITWPLKIKIVTPKNLRFSVFMAVESRWFIIDHQHKNFFYCNKTANINMQNISLYTCNEWHIENSKNY